MTIRVALAALAATLVATQAAAASSCLRQAQIYNWNAPNDTTLIVEDDLHQKFKITLFSKCLNLTFKQRIGFKVFGGTALSCVSSGDTIITGSQIGPQSCAIRKIEPYTPDMEKADKAAAAAAKAAAH
jgi:hypothetical protein